MATPAAKRKPRTLRSTTISRGRALATSALKSSPKEPSRSGSPASPPSRATSPQSRPASSATEHRAIPAPESSPASPASAILAPDSSPKAPPRAGSPASSPSRATSLTPPLAPELMAAADPPPNTVGTRLTSAATPAATPAATLAATHAQNRVPGATPTGQTRTWSSLFTSAKLPERVNLKYEEAVFSDGVLQLSGSPEEVEEGAAHWRNSLVGHFIGRRPNFLTVQTKVQSMWKPTGSMEVLSLPSGFFIFRFGLAEDRDRILEGGPWFVQNKLLLLKAWTPESKLEKPDLSTVPIWVKIHNLPLCLWTPSFIGRIASSLGQPLYIDQQTASKTRVNYARVCIEVSSQQELPDHLRFCFNGAQKYTLNLEYDWKPTRCSHCCTFGHTPASCPKQQQVQKKTWVPVKEPRAVAPLVEKPSQQQSPTQAEPVQVEQTPTVVTERDQSHGTEGGSCNKQTEQQPRVKLSAKEKGKSIVVEVKNQITTKNNFDCLIALGDIDAPDEPTPKEGPKPPPPKSSSNG